MANPEFEAFGSKRMRFVESDEKADINDANDYLPRRHSPMGYYTDSGQHETAVPVILAIATTCTACGSSGRVHGDTSDPADTDNLCEPCDGEGCIYSYIPGVRGPNDDKRAGCFDFADEYENADEAAKAAHNIAASYAESEREEDAKFQCEQQIEDALDSIRSARSQHSAIVREMAAGSMSQDEATTPAVYAAL